MKPTDAKPAPPAQIERWLHVVRYDVPSLLAHRFAAGSDTSVCGKHSDAGGQPERAGKRLARCPGCQAGARR